MKHILILLILVAAIGKTSAQKPWKWTALRGPNTGSHNAQLLVGANGEIISVGNAGYYSSTNDGLSWEYHRVIPNLFCQSLTYVISGLVVSTSGEYYFYYGAGYCDTTDNAVSGVYRSTDKGSTWKQVLKSKNVYGMIQSINNSLIITTQGDASSNYYGYLLQSIDKGLSWTEIATLPGYTLHSATNDFIYFTIGGNYCYQFSFASKTIQSIFPTSSYDTTGFVLLNNNLLLFNNSTFFISNGNLKWDTVGILNGIKGIVKGKDNKIYSIVHPNEKDLSVFLISDQGGSSSFIAKVSVYHPGDQYTMNYQNPDMLLYENDTALYLSRDRGSSWNEIGMPFDSVNNVVVSNDGKIFTEPVDRYDWIQHEYDYFDAQLSSDKGQNWYKAEPAHVRITGIGKGVNGSILALAPDSNENWNSIWLFDSSEKSQWKKRSVTQHIYAHAPIVSDGSKFIYIASTGYNLEEPTIFRSDDNGFSWIDIEPPNTSDDIYSIDASTDGTLYFGSYPVMYRSGDHGATWTKLLPVNDIVKLTYIKSFGADGVLLGTEGDGLLISSDKGSSWTRIDGKNFDTVTCIAITSASEIAAGTNRGLWISDSTKRNWTKVMLGNQDNLRIGAIDVSNTDDFYIGTYGASVWNGTRHYNSNVYSHNSNSMMRISPNPASERITFDLDLPNESKVRLELFDVLGRRIAVIADGAYSGENRIYFNSLDFPRGVYTIVLSGSKNETQKFILR